MIDLQKFCHKNNNTMNRPWTKLNYTYATNGFILVRVPAVYGIEENSMAPNNAPSLLPENIITGKDDWIIPTVEKVKLRTCSSCGGIGRMSNCPECGGEGFVTLDNQHNSYEVDCQTCDGYGTLGDDKGDMICNECIGTGKAWPDKAITIGGNTFTLSILRLIVDLPDIKIEPEAQNENPVQFCFDYGDGVIMPLLVKG
jgi:hypothetical protein